LPSTGTEYDAIYTYGATAMTKRLRPTPGLGTLKVRVQTTRCQGHARCAAVAPELFRLDELGDSRPIGDGTIPQGLEDKARLASANCPEIAIDIIEE
jgi:ferredoxin